MEVIFNPGCTEAGVLHSRICTNRIAESIHRLELTFASSRLYSGEFTVWVQGEWDRNATYTVDTRIGMQLEVVSQWNYQIGETIAIGA